MDEEIIVSLDGGSSLGKGCWRVVTGSPHGGKGFSSNARQGWISQANAVDQELHSHLDPDSVTVELRAKTWTVGTSARYKSLETNVRTAKSRTAAVRVLGMLGKALEDSEITQGTLDLRILLPAGERRSFKKLEQDITQALYEVKLKGKGIALTIKSVRVYPEGAGVAQSIADPIAIILMFGHKDLSILPVNSGVIQTEACQTLTGMGMVALINEFPCPINDELLLAKHLHLESVGKKGLSSLFTGDQLSRAKKDFQRSKERIWRRIWDQLEAEPLVKASPKIYVTGGSFRVWQKELSSTFGKRLVFLKSSLEDLTETYPDFDEPQNKELKPRFTDSFLLMRGGRNG